jgi:uncharacterized protein YlbG (UPF0298 family)
MRYSTNQLRDLSSLFSRSEALRWFKNDFSSINTKLQRYNNYDNFKGKSYLEVLKKAYKTVEKNYPNEYVVKNEFLHKWLLKELGQTHSVVYNELRIGKAVADLAMFNGISKVFEIKTILDKETRLSTQLVEYKKIFNEVYLIVPHCHLEKYAAYDISIGIITYESDSKQFHLFRKAIYCNDIDVDVMMNVLHSKEYLKIVQESFIEKPVMNAFTQFEICKKMLSTLSTNELNKLLIDSLKKRQINNAFLNKSNYQFNQIFLSLNLSIKERDSLILNLETNLV